MTADESLFELLAALKARRYQFIAVTPATHARVLARPPSTALTLRDIFGWNRTFEEHQIEPELLALLRRANCLEERNGQFRSLVRVASLDGELLLHSPFPTDAPDAVFFGPDTYRFARSIVAHLSSATTPSWIVDMGAGSGAGAIIAGKHAQPERLTMVDVNPLAARLARVNASFAGVLAEITVCNRIPNGCDLVIANPPYMIDCAHRTYRDGGAIFGGEVACDWVDQALSALVPGGTLILYTGAAVIDGRFPLVDRLRSLCDDVDAALHVDEIDPDVFGEELDRLEYRPAERIAAVGVQIRTQ